MTSASHRTNELADLVGTVWSSARVSEALGMPKGSLSAAQRAGTLLGLRTSDGSTFYPIWQFHRTSDGTVEVRPALAAVFRELRDHDPWTVAVLILTPAPELDGRTPLDAARAGVPSDVLAQLAGAVAREWSAGAAPPSAAPSVPPTPQ